MSATLAEQALSRALDYLADSGLELTDDITSEALALTEEGLRECPDDILPWLMRQLPQRYDLPCPDLPMTQPPLCRGSIGYRSA